MSTVMPSAVAAEITHMPTTVSIVSIVMNGICMMAMSVTSRASNTSVASAGLGPNASTTLSNVKCRGTEDN
ncbi:MAG: hypothetical protein QOJ87_1346 [Verrucomicrobiota bacterium]